MALLKDNLDEDTGDGGEPAAEDIEPMDGGGELVPMEPAFAEPPVAVRTRAFMRVLSDRVGQIKSLSNFIVGTGIPLRQRAVAFTMHRAREPEDSGVQVEIAASPVGAGMGNSSVVIATDFAGISLHSLQQGVLGWKPSNPDVLWRLEDCSLPEEATHEMIRSLFAAGALEGNESSMHPANPQQAEWALQMERDGLVVATMPGQYQLTKATARRVAASQKVESCPIFSVREHVPIADRSEYELCQMLVDAGWVWRIMPRTLQDRRPLVYRPGSEKMWYTLSHVLDRYYMLCLIESERLFAAGLEGVPHYRPKAIDFQNLFEGAMLADLPAIPDRAERIRREALQDDAPTRRVRPRLEDDDFVDSDFENDCQALLDRDNENLQDAESEVEQQQQQQDAGESEPEADENEDVQEEALEDDQCHDEVVAVPAGRQRRAPAFIMTWGNGFVIRWSRGGGERVLECACPWHRRSEATGCKKTLSWPADMPHDEGYDLVVRALKWWANQATQFSGPSAQAMFCCNCAFLCLDVVCRCCACCCCFCLTTTGGPPGVFADALVDPCVSRRLSGGSLLCYFSNLHLA